MLQNITDIPIERNDYYLCNASISRDQPPTSSKNTMLSWEVERPFQVMLHSLQNSDIGKTTPILLCIQLGLYHGGNALCKIQTIDVKYSINVKGACEYEELVTFDIDVCNLPRMTRLCVAINEKNTNFTLGWFNIMVYDYQNILKTFKRRKCNTWPSVGNKGLNPLGTVELNYTEDRANFVMSFVT
jgi:phosphatidylinositol-4,5-bisphosphate 3-kinase catalytic subunit alpha/beta/delta